MSRFTDFLFPELRELPADVRLRRLDQARQTPLDALELFGMAAGLVVVTALTRYAGDSLDAASRMAAALANFAVALPLLVLILGPFHVRRLRRGLRDKREERDKSQPDTHPR